ncbi:MAG: GAF domain-containing protein [Chloroflexaceae bacterium]|nr:GAF domain-containing protein [Chloroflexaceae bacterium]
MSSPSASILRRTMSDEKFEQLCQLWQQSARNGGNATILVAEVDLLPQFADSNACQQERFRLLLGPQINALLIGNPLGESTYQVTITFDANTIANFLGLLQQHLQHQPTLSDRLQQFSQLSIQEEPESQPQFVLELLGILTPDPLNNGNSEIAYPRFANQQFASQALRHQLERERILQQVSVQIDQNLDWLVIVKMTIQQVQKLLQVDRLVVYQLEVELAGPSGEDAPRQLIDAVTYEAKAAEAIPSILHFRDETCFADIPECRHKYRQGFSFAVEDIETTPSLSPCLRDLMRRLHIRAKLVTPVLVQGQLWGFVIAHQCYAPRTWKAGELQFLRQVADYLAISIYQAQSYHQLQIQKATLEKEVTQRAQQLQEALLAAQAANQSKSEFLGNISHELRTPLTSVIGLSGTLLHWTKNGHFLSLSKQQRYLQAIQDSGRQLLSLINNILDFRDIQAGKSSLQLRPFSLIQFARSAIAQIQPQAEQRQILLELDFQVPVQQDRFLGDRERLGQILFHLLQNAVKFTPEGGSVTLWVWREDQQVVFQVEDTGIGVAPEQLPLLFESFQQLEHYRQRTHGGAGIGLALVKQLVELHGGRIEVDSTPGVGSSFTVWLPSPTLAPKIDLIPHPPLTQPRKTVVLVEPDEAQATLVCELLTAADFRAIWLIDSATAIPQIELLQPAIAILDDQLPEVVEVSRALKQTLHPPKVLLLCVQPPPGTEPLAAQGIDDYLLKPIQPPRLLEKIGAMG